MGAYIIAEAGVNHNGRLDLAKELCLAAKNAGADCVKFQTWQTEKIITRSVAQADYQADNTGRAESQFDMLKRLELSYDDFRAVKAYCDEIGIQFASTADEADSLDFLLTLGIPFIKIGSGEIGNIPYLRYMGSKKKPVLLSTGMSSLADVELSLEALRQGGAEDITLLHCTTSYPCPYDRVNLRAMDTLRAAFGLPVGYSDHTEGIAIPSRRSPWGRGHRKALHAGPAHGRPGPPCQHRAGGVPADGIRHPAGGSGAWQRLQGPIPGGARYL